MAATLLRRSTVVWVPPRSVGERGFATEPALLVCPPPARSGGAPRWQRSSLEAMPAAKSVTLLFDARDVTLLALKLPPLSGARLARALPNLVEDALLQEVQGCAIAVGPPLGDGARLLAVIDRGWLEFVVGAFERRGMKVAVAWPAQLTLPHAQGSWSIAMAQGGIAVRTGAHEGFGWAGAPADGDVEMSLAAALDAAAPASGRPSRVEAYLEDGRLHAGVTRAAQGAGMQAGVADLPEPVPAPVDLLGAIRRGAGARWLANVDWRAWRLPAAIAAAAVVVSLVGLNVCWIALARERDGLRAQMESTFRQAFPNAQVVVDPLLQMQRQVAELRLNAGRSGPGDYLPLVARLSEALGARAADAIASLEYRDGRARVRLRAGFFEGPSARDTLAAACQQRGLKVDFEGEGDATIMVVRPA